MKRHPGQLERELQRWARAPRPETIEVPGPGQESVWDYPRPPRLEAVRDVVRVEFAGRVIAESSRALRVLETAAPPTYYVPAEDVDRGLLVPATDDSYCEWKGTARYWDLVAGDKRSPRAAWSYPDPYDDYAQLKDALAFFAARVDACWVGQERTTPQPGDFYGGWVTRGIAGPFKGSPGSEEW